MAEEPTGLVSSSLLDKIDKLFECKVGEHVDLPQLVVVGNQSSGKSSVLEALTELPFPRDSGLCTRFATQITFRRSAETKISASIIPAKNSPAEYSERLKAWQKTNLQALDAVSFGEIMKEVTDAMEIGTLEGKPKTFSADVLRLELTGPSQPHFSVIDVPGIFKKVTAGVTTKEDMAMVAGMVRGYMENHRSVILAVIPANVDIATQEILDSAEELDPDGIRTLGILTKPDLVDKGAEPAVMDIVQGRSHSLQLGWHLLKNPGQAKLVNSPSERRMLEEDFFSKQTPWNSLERDRVGVGALKARLQEILADHIRREFPKVKTELNNKLKKAEEDLHALGPKRQTHSELNVYMMGMAVEFQRIVGLASRSNYNHSDLFDRDDSLRLATTAVSRGEAFSTTMACAGHKYYFDPKAQSDEPIGEINPSLLKDDDSKDPGHIKTRNQQDHSDVEDMIEESGLLDYAIKEGIMDWLETVYLKSRGFELGTFDTSLLAVTMKHQAAKWRDIALGYTSDVITLVHNFVLHILEEVAPNKRVLNGIKGLLIEKLRDKYAAALDHTKFLLQVELEGTPATLNHYFNDNLDKSRKGRLRDALEGNIHKTEELGEVVRVGDIMQSHPLSNTKHLVREIHDILHAYYKLALKRFVDNVRMQVADHFLVTGPKTPLTLFSPEFVAAMPATQLEEIAGEELYVKNHRANLESLIKQLKEGKKILSGG